MRGNLASHDGIAGIAEHGERLGFVSATIAGHIVFPVWVESNRYDASGDHPSSGDAIEPLSLMAVAAGRTTTLRFVTSVPSVPYRNPVLAAKMIASIDVLSQGRVTLVIDLGDRRCRGVSEAGRVASEFRLQCANPEPHAGTNGLVRKRSDAYTI